ncbi:MAG: putative toxin-antitoxin system toxin component, PIN family [Betaproteobacteria bacterium]|nr:putative toxin-antitoxin system toxin component, PIN family [Betaproteobacteria bacterium]MBI2223500.1 putative toxin-antitoxin system toxin component, PIN family [Betaproteobacteria bacterium]MBI2291720.1 putative toxin-antitoxin system toxin component, PIN family [Betaproteobacteria bacterium]MBI3052866.1 putative toxin-antitoxin system toxin component, PIN family [Betaproteobacteria bacterium]
MGKKNQPETPPLRVVLDSNVAVSALLFRHGELAWLRTFWQSRHFIPLASRATIEEILRVIGYEKFHLGKSEMEEVAALYLPHVEIITVTEPARRKPPVCRDPGDQEFLALAHAGNADVIVTGDKALLELSGKTRFAIESPAAFRRRLAAS